MDVAGLVPGASEGRGLGNKFLDDLRLADVLIHVVDASGTTDDNGRETKGYDPINDIQWLRSEIEAWIFGNLERKWSSIIRRHIALKTVSSVDTLHGQLAGYGTTKDIVQKAMDFSLKSGSINADVDKWNMEELRGFVKIFLDQRFPTIVALNKIDMPDADKNISAIVRRYQKPNSLNTSLRDGVSGDNIILTSALSECFLRKISKQGYIRYQSGDDDFYTKSDKPNEDLRELDEKISRRLDNIRDLVLFRYGSTGVQEVIIRAVEVIGFIPVFPVKSLTTFGASMDNSSVAFQDCVLVKPGTTVREFARKLHNQLNLNYVGAETIGNIQLAEDDVIIPGKNNIIKISTSTT
ncbi:hypothetical protein H4S08_003145 [Coemansia sp. RSA 1365]|nr:hypothetical protein H4S08_003145 [Coemansia sp. RSA 1365]